MSLEPQVNEALERAYEAGRSLIARSVDRLAPQTRYFLCDGRTLGIGVLVAVSGWLFLMLGLIDGLSERYPRFVVELAVGLAHGGAAALLVFRGRRTPSRREPEAGARLGLVVREAPQRREPAASAAARAKKAKLEEPRPLGESTVEWMLANASAALLGAAALAILIARMMKSAR